MTTTAQIRAELGLPADPASDAIWAQRIAAGTHTLADAQAALQRKVSAWDAGQIYAWKPGATSGAGYAPEGWVGPTAAKQRTSFFDQASALFPWLPKELLDTWVDGMIKHGNPEVALGLVRQHPSYDTYFAGNRREDGSLRFSEQEYARQIEGYERVLQYYDIPIDTFRHRFKDLIVGGVAAEEFQSRVDRTYVEVMSRSDQIKQAYANYYGLTDISDAALLASAIDPSLSPAELQLRISRAQIGGAAKESGFDIHYNEAARLQSAGLGYEAAANFYRQAKGLMPTLGDLVARHNDPDDEFSLDELTDALIFSDPEQAKRISRLTSGEKSLFSGQGSVAQTEQGMVGLRQR